MIVVDGAFMRNLDTLDEPGMDRGSGLVKELARHAKRFDLPCQIVFLFSLLKFLIDLSLACWKLGISPNPHSVTKSNSVFMVLLYKFHIRFLLVLLPLHTLVILDTGLPDIF